MRPIISYDDITAPQPAVLPPPPKHQTNPSTAQHPTKKRKTGPHQRQGGSGGSRAGKHAQHWDDPGNQGMQVTYDDKSKQAEAKAVAVEEEEYYEEEESRELTHEEIWDDSALIDAWNSAAAEYEAFHGPGKKWKQEQVKKSPLSWYNIPPEKTSRDKSKVSLNKTNGATDTVTNEQAGGTNEVADSTPINFDTFVPSHDPTLASAAGVGAATVAESTISVPAMDSALGSGVEAAMVSQDEAFSRAMTAMYWSGYWTAVYHCRRNEPALQISTIDQDYIAGQDEDGAEEGEEDEDEDMLPAQR